MLTYWSNTTALTECHQYTGIKFLPKKHKTDLLSCKKEQNISFCLLTHVNLYDGTYSGFKIVSLRLWRVEYLHGMCAARNTHQWCVVKVLLQQTTHRLLHNQLLHNAVIFFLLAYQPFSHIFYNVSLSCHIPTYILLSNLSLMLMNKMNDSKNEEHVYSSNLWIWDKNLTSRYFQIYALTITFCAIWDSAYNYHADNDFL